MLQRLMSRRIKFVSHFIQELFQWFMHKMIEGKRTDAWRRIQKLRKFSISFFFYQDFWVFIHIYTISHASIERIIQSTTVINSVYVCLLLVSAGRFFFSCCCCSFSLFVFFISWSYLMCGIPVVNFTMQILFIRLGCYVLCVLFAPIKN